jgi:hypothetical protein
VDGATQRGPLWTFLSYIGLHNWIEPPSLCEDKSNSAEGFRRSKFLTRCCISISSVSPKIELIEAE